jgi:hypothetical protein
MLYGGGWEGINPSLILISITSLLSLLFIYISVSKLAKIDEDNYVFYMMIENRDKKLISAFRLMKLGILLWLLPLFRIYFIYFRFLTHIHYADYREILIYLGFSTLNNTIPILLLYIIPKILKKGRGLIIHIIIFDFLYIVSVALKMVFFHLGQPIGLTTLSYYIADFLLFFAFTLLCLNFYTIIREYGTNN